MGRAGRGGGGGSSRSSGSRSSSRSSGSRRMSGYSHRAGRSSSSSSHSSFRSSSSRSSHTHYSSGHSNLYYGSNPYSNYPIRESRTGCRSGCLTPFLIMLVIMFIMQAFGSIKLDSLNVDYVQREKLETGQSYDRNVVLLDEIDWIEEPSRLGNRLIDFFNKTGVQPYFIMLDYNEALQTDTQKEEYAVELYDKYISREDALLFVYFGEWDLENDVGLMSYVLGKQVNSVFDDLAIDTWYAQINKYWYQDIDTTDLFIRAYNDTADKIMAPKPDYTGVLRTAIIGIVVVSGLAITLVIIINVNRRHKEKAKETERILNTPMESLANKEAEDIMNKYK